jgi:beta-lactamase class A
MSAPDVIGMVVAGTAIMSALLAGIIWLIRAQVAMQKQFQPNGGQSVRDSLTRIEKDVREIRGKVDDHIEWHMDQR